MLLTGLPIVGLQSAPVKSAFVKKPLASALCYAADELLVLDGPPEFVGDDFVAVVVGM